MTRQQPAAHATSVTPRTSRRRLLGGAAAAAAGAAIGVRTSPTASKAAQPDPAEHVQAIVTSDDAATQAGMDILAQGGTAADAAIAVAGVLSVVEPWFSSALGGGTWALYYDAEAGEVTSLDGVGPVGSLADVDDFEERADTDGIHMAIVPGAWDGWMLWLERYGQLDLGELLEPAIRLARDGHPVSASMASGFPDDPEDWTDAFPATAELYAPGGTLLEEGDTITQPAMADTFEALAQAYDEAAGESREAAIQAARDYFYRGPIAESIVAFSDENDGYFTLEDFNSFEAQIVAPIAIDYDDSIMVLQNPPNSQGITQLFALNILKDLSLASLDPDSADALHLQVEAVKLAFADRHQYIGDPARIDIPIDELLSDEHAAMQRERIDMDTAMEWPVEAGSYGTDSSHTTTYSIVDQYGNGAAVTTSTGNQFNVLDDTGIHINTRMRFVAVEDGDPNQLTPGYKVRHTSCPYMAFRDGRLYILGGNTGADTQTQAQTQQVVSVLEFGMSAQEALDHPRFVSSAFPSTTFPYEADNTLRIQSGVARTVIDELRERGHDVSVGRGGYGQASMLVLTEDGSDAEVGVEPGSSRASGEAIPAD